MKSYTLKIILTLLIFGFSACEKPLEEEIFSELEPSTLFSSEEGVNVVLNSAYAYAHRSGLVGSWSPFYLGGMPAGEIWGAGGSIENLWVSLIDFTWDANHAQILTMWTVYYNAIRDANIVLDNLENEALSEEFRALKEAEVHFIRGWCYAELYNLFGPVPLYTSSTDAPLQPNGSEGEIRTFIEQELMAAVNSPSLAVLPQAFGMASKGAAMGILTKHYMNTRQWQKAADLAQDIIELNEFGLVSSSYADVFSISNEGNQELLWALPKHGASGAASMAVNALMFPPNYPLPYPNNSVFAARTYLYDEFVNSFEVTDERRNMIDTAYVTTAGELVQGLGNDQSFPFKFEFDPNSVGASAGNDIPVVRYADILLSRAEALNEVSGPSQEAIDLMNQVRDRAGVAPLTLAGFSQESLRDAILEERAKEFFFEGKRREDLLRHDRFISNAVARGKNAQPHHVLYPIPQVELDANELLEQNSPNY
ncbi:RagB/SusD family nutrient uptake outer membrane protein [Catalinimonas alkaloidigena]|uniref:RagB/SusD family nutrient uptake outer membrane protein n=1 Tax=Catalinimonas alkaloidigena TaxID=1075417 RepID=UPI00240662D7|nr:RagB/SusD family nutrient uptake outer membrane protein [Catalinimonas alkaloidigena]